MLDSAEDEEKTELLSDADHVINHDDDADDIRNRNHCKPQTSNLSREPEIVALHPSDHPASNALYKQEMLKKHDRLLLESKRSVLFFMFCTLFTAFLRSSRENVWILYARLFYVQSTENIAWLLYGGAMFSGLSALFYSSVADYIGYDRMMVILLTLKSCGVFLECLGIDFSLLIIGYLLTALAVLYVCLSYISWILPHKYAVQYTSYFYACYFMSYLMGAMVGSILSFYFNYRLIFWVNFAFMVFIALFGYFFILGIQVRLERKQLKMAPLYQLVPLRRNHAQHQLNTFENRQSEEDEEEAPEAENMDDKLSDVNERFSVVMNHGSNTAKYNASYFGMRSMTWMHWTLLLCILLQHSMVLCVDALWILYYNVYIVDKFHSSIIVGASQIVVVCVSFALGNLSIPHILTANWCNVRDNKYYVIMCCSIMLIGMFGFAYPLTNDLNAYWVYSIFTGYVSGILSMTMEIIILELQPKEYTGRVNGIKGFTRFFTTANGVLVAGLLWKVTYNSMFYTQAAAHCLELLLILFMIAIQHHQKRLNRPRNHFGDQIRVQSAAGNAQATTTTTQV